MTTTWKRRTLGASIAAGSLFVLLLLWPARPIIPVEGASTADWNHQTFWYHPWGRSGVHKGIDVFARHGTPVLASVGGLVVQAGEISMGGRVIVVLGPKWRFHYYAHLASHAVSRGDFVRQGEVIGTVGNSGNAAGKPPHLHYAVVTGVPYPWRISSDPQGWKKMFFLDPDRMLRISARPIQSAPPAEDDPDVLVEGTAGAPGGGGPRRAHDLGDGALDDEVVDAARGTGSA